MKTYIKTGFMIAAVICWCSLMYPELVMNPEIVRVMTELGEAGTPEAAEYYRMLLEEPEQIEIKFKIVEYMKNMR